MLSASCRSATAEGKGVVGAIAAALDLEGI